MRIELTVEGPTERCDLAVDGPDPVRWKEVARQVTSSAGMPTSSAVFAGRQAVDAGARLGSSPLTTGAVLRSHPADDESAPATAGPVVQVSGGPCAGRWVPVRIGRLLIGRGPDCDLRLDDDSVSRRHAVLEVAHDAMTVRDLGSTNGTSLAGSRVGTKRTAVGTGEMIRLGDSVLEVRECSTEPASFVPRPGALLVNRAPREPGPALPTDTDVAPPPVRAPRRPVQWLAALLPAAAGGVLAWVTGSVQFLLFTALTPVLILSTSLGERLRGLRRDRGARRAHRVVRADSERAAADGKRREALARRYAAPDPATLARIARTPGRRLWERRRTDADLLQVRLGCADRPARMRIRSGRDSESAGTVADVPATVDLSRGALGLVGPSATARAVARWLVAQLAVLVSPADLDLALFLSEDDESWRWARWLPHLGARVACTPGERAELSALIATACRASEGTSGSGRRVVVVVDRAGDVGELAELAPLLAPGAVTTVTAICLAASTARLPAWCSTVAHIGGDAGTRLGLPEIDIGEPGATVEAVADQVSGGWAEGVARALAPLVDGGAAGDARLPTSVSLLEVLDLAQPAPDDIAEFWERSDGGLSVTIGVDAHGPVAVDLVVDGPHALIGGTTGSGKSALLQTLVAGLALCHPPSAVTFVLIDYKGGAAFGACDRLPHAAGVVTDLDPHLTRRALRSLDAEIRRRERLFAEVGAADLAAYRSARPDAPIARLVIVVDEFATLADELPEFVRGLVGVAQRGRSLGLHLVLATQRPGRAVSAEIKANTALRIALRVTDPSESTEIVGTAHAAAIPRDTPGRAYLRLGSELTCLQVAVPLQAPPTEPRIEVLAPWRRRPSAAIGETAGGSTVSALVAQVRAAAEATGHAPATGPWRPPLPTELDLGALTAVEGTRVRHQEIGYGLVDLPDRQTQRRLTLDLAHPAGILVCGAARSGRTSALITVAVSACERIEPAGLELHVIDASGTLVAAVRELPHVATALGPADLHLVPTLLRRLGTSPPSSRARLLLVDDFDRVLAGHDDAAPTGLAGSLLDLLAAASDTNLTSFVSGGRSLLGPRFASAFGTRLLLRLNDRADYALAGIPAAAVPATMPPGRGVRATDGAEFQLATCCGTGHPPRSALPHAAEIAMRWRAATPPAHSVVIRALPPRVGSAALARSRGTGLVLGVGGDAAAPVTVDPFAGSGRLLIAGPSRSGRSTALITLLTQATCAGIECVAAAPDCSPLRAAADELGVRVITPADPASEIAGPPPRRTLLLVDDSDAFLDTPAGEQFGVWLRQGGTRFAAVVSARSDDLATAYRGLGVEVRRSRSGLLLQPGVLDGELFGIRLGRGGRVPASAVPPGRGLLINAETSPPSPVPGEPMPIQVAWPETAITRRGLPCGDSDDRSVEPCSP